MRTVPLSLRNIPADVVETAAAIAQQTGLSIADVYRLALGSGVLVEATKITPDRAGTYAGLDGVYLAKALRRHLGSAIDLLVASGEHPASVGFTQTRSAGSDYPLMPSDEAEKSLPFDPSLSDELESLGIGLGLSQQRES